MKKKKINIYVQGDSENGAVIMKMQMLQITYNATTGMWFHCRILLDCSFVHKTHTHTITLTHSHFSYTCKMGNIA